MTCAVSCAPRPHQPRILALQRGTSMHLPCSRRFPRTQQPVQGTSGSPDSRFRTDAGFLVTPESWGLLPQTDPLQARAEVVHRLHEACSGRIYGFLRKSLPADAAEDLTQETFLRLLQHKNLERKSISISYLFRVAQNLLRRRFNVATRGRRVLETILVHETERRTQHKSPDSSMSVLQSEALLEALSQLAPQEQSTIRMIVCEGKTYREAAHALGVPVSTVNNWKHRALSKMRGIIDAANTPESEHLVSEPADARAAPGGRAQKACGSCGAHRSTGSMGADRSDRMSRHRGTRVAG